MTDQEKLYNICKEFITKQHISCPETISQTDKVIENAYDFIEEICNIVGYYQYLDDE